MSENKIIDFLLWAVAGLASVLWGRLEWSHRQLKRDHEMVKGKIAKEIGDLKQENVRMKVESVKRDDMIADLRMSISSKVETSHLDIHMKALTKAISEMRDDLKSELSEMRKLSREDIKALHERIDRIAQK